MDLIFQIDSDDRMELTVRGSEYGILADGDVGMLSFQEHDIWDMSGKLGVSRLNN